MTASVLMSIYNESAGQIRESVSSVLTQDFEDFDLIVVLDNPERKDVDEILDGFKDTRIVLVKNEKNIGLAMSMNIAVNISTSDIIIRMDADDTCLPERFKREIEIIQSGNYDFVFSNYDIINQQSQIIRNGVRENDISDINILNKMVSLDPSMIHHPTVAFTRVIFEKVGGYRDFPCSQDSDLWLRMAESGCRFYKLGSPYLQYRINPNSVTNKRWYQQQLTCHYIFELSIERLTQNRDNYSLEDYHRYLNRFKVNDESAKQNLWNAVGLLSKSAYYSSRGEKLKSLLLRGKVFLISGIYRRHYYYLIKKLIMLRK